MALIADVLLIAGALGAGFYCMVLSRRLTRFGNLEDGVGGAVATLSRQVAELTEALDRAQRDADGASSRLADQLRRADEVANRLESMASASPEKVNEAPLPSEPASSTSVRPVSGAPSFRRRGMAATARQGSQ